MSQPAPESAASSTTSSSERTTEQVAQERSMAAVSDVLLNIEGTLAHAKKARKLIDKDGANANANASLALGMRFVTSSGCASG